MKWISFGTWLEMVADQLSAKNMVLGYFDKKLGITDEEEILDTDLSDIDPSIVDGMLSLGDVYTSNQEVSSRIKNRSGTVRDLIAALANTAA